MNEGVWRLEIGQLGLYVWLRQIGWWWYIDKREDARWHLGVVGKCFCLFVVGFEEGGGLDMMLGHTTTNEPGDDFEGRARIGIWGTGIAMRRNFEG